MQLSLAERRKLAKSLSAAHKAQIKRHACACQMKGDGLLDIVKSVGKSLGSVGKAIGPTVLKELVIPLVRQKAGIVPSGRGRRPVKGRGIALAGGGRKAKKKQKGKGVSLAGGHY
jgi:hypothetical protein